MTDKTATTFVAFILPDKSMPLTGIPVALPVPCRDIAALAIPETACGFYFYDLTPASTGTDPVIGNVSPVYLIADRVLTRDEAKDKIMGHREWRKSGSRRFAFDLQVEVSEFFIITPHGTLQGLKSHHIVIDHARRQIHPAVTAPDASQRPAYDFNPALEETLRVPQLRLRRPSGPKNP